jgi:hypothetical protein
MSQDQSDAADRPDPEAERRAAALASAGDFDAVGIAKRLLRTIRAGALADSRPGGWRPFASLTTVATDSDGSPLLLMSQLSAHTQNLQEDSRASILLAQDRQGRPAGPSAPHRDRAGGHEPGAAGPAALSGAPPEGGALCGVRRFLVLAHRDRTRPP